MAAPGSPNRGLRALWPGAAVMDDILADRIA